MEFTGRGEFKVGNTALSTPIKIRVPDYGQELPEIHSSSPVAIPVWVKLAYVINWLERGIDIEFCNGKEDLERVFYFILEYNRYAQEENKKMEDIEGHYPLALNAQSRLYRAIDFKNYVDSRKAAEADPFKMNIFKGIPGQGGGDRPSAVYKNPLAGKNRKQSPGMPEIPAEEPVSPGGVYAYDTFAPIKESEIIERTPFDNLELR
jgi:hypothetical protein